MQQSTRPEVQPLSGPENEKGIKKEEADSTTLGSVPASASAPALASGGQQTLAPQVEVSFDLFPSVIRTFGLFICCNIYLLLTG